MKLCVFAVCNDVGRGNYFFWSVGGVVDGQCTIHESGISEADAWRLCRSLLDKRGLDRAQWRFILSPTPQQVLRFTGKECRQVYFMWHSGYDAVVHVDMDILDRIE